MPLVILLSVVIGLNHPVWCFFAKPRDYLGDDNTDIRSVGKLVRIRKWDDWWVGDISEVKGDGRSKVKIYKLHEQYASSKNFSFARIIMSLIAVERPQQIGKLQHQSNRFEYILNSWDWNEYLIIYGINWRLESPTFGDWKFIIW